MENIDSFNKRTKEKIKTVEDFFNNVKDMIKNNELNEESSYYVSILVGQYLETMYMSINKIKFQDKLKILSHRITGNRFMYDIYTINNNLIDNVKNNILYLIGYFNKGLFNPMKKQEAIDFLDFLCLLCKIDYKRSTFVVDNSNKGRRFINYSSINAIDSMRKDFNNYIDKLASYIERAESENYGKQLQKQPGQ